jgi:hypothetical protein
MALPTRQFEGGLVPADLAVLGAVALEDGQPGCRDVDLDVVGHQLFHAEDRVELPGQAWVEAVQDIEIRFVEVDRPEVHRLQARDRLRRGAAPPIPWVPRLGFATGILNASSLGRSRLVVLAPVSSKNVTGWPLMAPSSRGRPAGVKRSVSV